MAEQRAPVEGGGLGRDTMRRVEEGGRESTALLLEQCPGSERSVLILVEQCARQKKAGVWTDARVRRSTGSRVAKRTGGSTTGRITRCA